VSETAIMTSYPRKLVAPCFVVGALAASSFAPAQAQSVEEFYTGKTITLSIGFTPGGGYDLYGRLVARHLGKHIPGKPGIVAQNMPGAGSMRAAQHLFSIAPKDGTALATFGRQMGITPLLNPAAQYDGTRFTWLGSVTNEVSTCVTWNTSPVKDWNGLLKHPVTFAGDGPGADPDVFANLYNNVFNTKIKIISGYRGTNPMILAMERGEVDGFCGLSWSTVKARHMDWFKNKTMNVLVQAALQKEADIPEVPLALDLAKTEEQRQILKVILTSQEIARPFAAPPGVPAARAQALQRAFAATHRDPQYLAEADKQRIDISPVSAEQVLQALKRLESAPPQQLDYLRRLFAESKG
jgi:tripartite-type tricarboxylate transporter receptor subunit TctC